MQCGYPYTIDKPGGKSYTVACGRCLACRINRVTEWTTRIIHEAKAHEASLFTTLTYRQEDLPQNESLVKRDLQLFFKRFRKSGFTFRYYACGEYGEKRDRPHYHAILFGIKSSNQVDQLIHSTWGKGRTGNKHFDKNGCGKSGTVTEQSARYCAGYVLKKLIGDQEQWYKDNGRAKEFCLMSRRPGIGAEFAAKYRDVWLQNGYIALSGSKRQVPRYYKSYYTTKERERFNSNLAERRFEIFYNDTGSREQTWIKMRGDVQAVRQQIMDKKKQLDLYKRSI